LDRSPTKTTKAFLPLLTIACLSLGSCNPAPPRWEELMKDDPVIRLAKQTKTPATTDDLVIYVDTSQSMAGYVSKDPLRPSLFSRTLQELRNVSTILQPPLNIHVRRIAANVSGSLNETFLNDASIRQAVFNGAETNLSGAIESFLLPVAASDGESPMPPARFHVLITDGVQSRRSGDASCAAGSDQVCVRKKILALLSQGWAGYVMGIRSEFKGKLYSEITRAVIPYETADIASYRPFYLYLFSPDAKALDQLLQVLSDRLQPLLPAPDSLRLVALTAAYADGFGRSELKIEKEAGTPLMVVAHADERPSRVTLKVSLETENTGSKRFAIVSRVNWSESIKATGTPEELAALVNWQLIPIYPSTVEGNVRLPELKLLDAKPQTDGTVRLQVSAGWPKAVGTPSWRGYRLEARLNLEQQTPGWVKQWSTDLDTSADVGNRTLFLESALLGVWRNPELEKQVICELYLRVGPK
jgi:hypothetical protein